MARSLQAPNRPHLPSPPPQYDAVYMRKLVQSIEGALFTGALPVGRGFVVTNRDTSQLTLDVATATWDEVRAFLGELAAALITSNKIGGEA